MVQVFDKKLIADLLRKGYFSYLSAIISIFIIPIHVQYLPPFMILWTLSWIFESYFRGKAELTTKRTYSILFILFILFYLWKVVGLIYSEDIKIGLSNLFGRLSLIIFPLILLSPGEMIKQKAGTLLRIFALGTVLFMLFCFTFALYRSISIQEGVWIFESHLIKYPWLSYFYGADLVISQHPTYISMYVVFSVFVSLESFFDNSFGLSRRLGWLIVSIILLISVYFLSSRAGILTSLILVPLYLIRTFRKIGNLKFVLIGITAVLLALFPVILNNQRVNSLYERIFEKPINNDGEIDPRIVIWESTLNIVRNNFVIGVGIGDVRNDLVKEYKKIAEQKMAEDRLNAHNQFLEVLVENGIIGLAIFCSIFISMFSIAFTERSFLYLIFILMMILFFMFETILYRLAGVSYFSLFSFLLLHFSSYRKS